MGKKSQARLRLATSDGELVSAQADRWSASNLSAASPRGAAVRPCSISLTADGLSPINEPIAESVMSLERRSEIREAHVLMPHTLRHPVGQVQRLPVTEVRDNLCMPRPADLQKFDRLGDRIVYWRERRGMKRPELARLAKIPYSTLAELENNEQRSTTKITQIAAALRINPHYLATDKGDPEELTASPATEENSDWPFPFPRAELQELDEIELELAGLKFQKILDEIRSKRPHKRARKAG